MDASELRDGDDDDCCCCDDDDGDHARRQGCSTGFVMSGLRLARSIAFPWRLTDARRETELMLRPIRTCLKCISRQISQEKESPAGILNHK